MIKRVSGTQRRKNIGVHSRERVLGEQGEFQARQESQWAWSSESNRRVRGKPGFESAVLVIYC